MVEPAEQAPDSSDQRRALHAYLSDVAHETWHQVGADLGASVSAMLEVLGQGNANPEQTGVQPITLETLPRLDVIVRAARNIDADRRRH